MVEWSKIFCKLQIINLNPNLNLNLNLNTSLGHILLS